MQELPHHYRAVAAMHAEGCVELSSPGLVTLESASPAEYGGGVRGRRCYYRCP
jgi:hypothetical protein